MKIIGLFGNFSVKLSVQLPEVNGLKPSGHLEKLIITCANASREEGFSLLERKLYCSNLVS